MLPSVWCDIKGEGRHEEGYGMYQPKHIPLQEVGVQRRLVQVSMGTPPGLVRHFQRQRIREARGLKGSLVSDGSFTKSEIRAMAENWVQVEDGPNIIDAEVYEGIELLENVFF